MSLFGWRGSKSSARKSPPRTRLQLEVLEDRTVPAVFNVGAGDVATLIADMNIANADGQSNTINLAAGTYDLTAVNNNMYGPNGLPAITNNLTINGNGAVIQRDPSLGLNDPFRLFYVSNAQGTTPAGDLTLANVTLEGGLAQGGNSGTGGGGLGAGGAIFNQGNLLLSGVTMTQNTALGGSDSLTSVGGGGGIGQNGRGDNGGGFGGVTVADMPSPFGLGGTSSSSGVGGAGGVGGGGGDSTATPASGVSANGGAGGFGGGGGSGSSGSGGGSGSSSSSNDLGGAGGFGGGGGSSGGTDAGGAGGFGAGQGSDNGGGGGAGLGGAIFNDGGTTTLVNSTLTANLAEGGAGGANAADGDGYGGAIFNLNGILNLTSSTLASNSMVGNTSGGGAVYNLALGNTASGQPGQAVVNLTDSILASSVGGSDLVNNQSNSTSDSAVVNATTSNIVTAMNTINGATTNGTPSDANPMLGQLANNGGLTPTMALLSGSPALGVGVGGGILPTTDQRGDTRGSVVDLGAVQETAAPAPGTTLTLTVSAANVLADVPITMTATVAATNFGAAAPTGTVQFVDTTTGTTLGSVALSTVNGQAQATLTSTLNLGTHAITATYQSPTTSTNTSTSSSSTNTSTNTLAGSSASLSVLVGSQDQLWLQQVYQTLLGRAVDPTGLAYWSTVMAQGTSRGEVAYLLQQTVEYQSDQITAAFQTLLNRPVDATSLAYYLGLMQSGDTIQTIDSMIVGSTEYYQDNGGTPTGFLTAIYKDFLNRDIDAASVTAGEQSMGSGETLTQVAQGVLSTTEYLTDMVQNDYQTYLNRAADTGSLNAFLTYLSVGGTNAGVVATLLGSPEYFSS